jgi:hypothetical protein
MLKPVRDFRLLHFTKRCRPHTGPILALPFFGAVLQHMTGIILSPEESRNRGQEAMSQDYVNFSSVANLPP